MSAVFLKLLNLSITASWLILAVVLVRFLLKKAPKWITCVLWALVAIRLVCPFSLESALSLIPSSETIPSNIEMMQKPAIDSGMPVINQAVNPVIANSLTPDPMTSANPLQIVIPMLSVVWIAGMAAMLLYALISYIRLKKSVGASVSIRDNILACDEVKSPFILGIIKPLIYVPSSMEGEALNYVITHESAHIQRRDHWWKPFGYLLLTIYWFNPLCYLAYVLLCRDIEMACDEKVIRDMDKGSVAAYSQALLDCSFPRRRIAACPLAFGEVGVKERVKSVLNYKKPAFWIIVVAVIACVAVAVCFMTNPFSDKSLSGKLGVSMDMAVAEYNHSAHSDGNFIATNYDVLRITKGKGKTTVYAWVYYAEYSFDGTDVKMESASHIPTVVTFDTSADGSDSSSYDVIEYWIPRDGSDYAKDIREKFPILLWGKAFDVSGASLQKEKCLQAARDYYGVGDTAAAQWDKRPMLVIDGKKYMDPYKPESTLPHGYSLAGTLTAEQAYNTGLEGTQYFTNPNEPDIFFTYQLCGTPTGLDVVDSENRNWQYLRWISADADELKERKLTLDDVRWLAQKGEALSWDDFDAYQGTDIGSGLYIMQYVIDDLFDVLVGGGSREADPEYVHLRNRDINAWVDIRTDDVDAFIKTYAGTDNYAGPNIPSDTANLITVRSSGKTIHPFLHFAYGSEWTDYGFIEADGTPIDGELTEWTEATYLPELVYSDDFAVSYADKVSFRYIIPFDESMQQMNNLFGVTELANLKPGKYYIGIVITQEGDYIEQAKQSEYTGWACLFRLTVE